MRIITLIAATAITFTMACAQDAEASKEWKLVWEDNFDSPQLNPDVWSRIDRGHVDWNRYMTKNGACYGWEDGCLVLRGLDAAKAHIEGDSVAMVTGGVWTKNHLAFGHGRIAVRAKIKGCQGSWPAIWMLPEPSFAGDTTVHWPRGGEIDIMERLSLEDIAYQTVHTYYTHNLGLENDPPHGATGPIDPDGFNVYSVDILPDRLIFAINGRETFTYPRIDTPLPGQYPFNSHKFYLLLDMQLSGQWVGKVDMSQLPALMYIDWVRYYE